MYQLTTKNSIGTISLKWVKGGGIESYQLGRGRFSLTPYQNFYLVNFWIVSEYEIVPPDGKIYLVTGPILEILTRSDHSLADQTYLKLTTPSRNEVQDDWDVIFRTGFYNQTHQDLNDSVLIVKQITNKFYDIHFSGRPSIDGKDYEVTGQCSVELSETLERYW